MIECLLMKNRPGMLKPLFAALAFCALAGALIFAKLDTVPGLHCDEAWAGLKAHKFMLDGFFSPHGMNWYTGPFHMWLTGKIFAPLGETVFALRLTSAALNTIAAGLTAFMLAAVFGWAELAVFAALTLCSPFFIFESRLGWEVCAFQNMLAAGVLASAWKMASGTRASVPALLVLFYCSAFGSINHLIFASLPFALAFGLVAWTAYSRNLKYEKLIFPCAANVAGALVMLFLKKTLSDAFWLEHKPVVTAAFFSLPAFFAAAAFYFQEKFGEPIGRLAAFITEGWRRKLLIFIAAAGLLASLWFHATAFMGIISGYNIFKRMFSLDTGVIAGIISFLWGGTITGMVISESFAELKRREPDGMRLMPALLLTGYFAVFTMFRNTNSIRYYIIPFFLFAVAAAVLLPDALKGRKKLAVALLAVPVFTLGLSLRELTATSERRPFKFTNGWHEETSAHFMRTDALAARMRDENTCAFEGEKFIAVPLAFYHTGGRWKCGEGKTASFSYCYDCTRPPYIR